jgi:hypothetical protein
MEGVPRLRLDLHRAIRPEERWGKGGRQGVQAGSVTDKGSGPRIVVRTKDKIGSLWRWTWCPPWEAWASELADLARHWLGETEDAPEELLRISQEPEEEAGRPQPHGKSSKAPRELVSQRGEH